MFLLGHVFVSVGRAKGVSVDRPSENPLEGPSLRSVIRGLNAVAKIKTQQKKSPEGTSEQRGLTFLRDLNGSAASPARALIIFPTPSRPARGQLCAITARILTCLVPEWAVSAKCQNGCQLERLLCFFLFLVRTGLTGLRGSSGSKQKQRWLGFGEIGMWRP